MPSDRTRRELQRRIPTGKGCRGGSSCGDCVLNGGLWWPETALEGGGTVHRPRRELKRRIPTGRGGQGGSSCDGFIVNGGLWWPEEALEALGFHGCSQGERERETCEKMAVIRLQFFLHFSFFFINMADMARRH